MINIASVCYVIYDKQGVCPLSQILLNFSMVGSNGFGPMGGVNLPFPFFWTRVCVDVTVLVNICLIWEMRRRTNKDYETAPQNPYRFIFILFN